MLNAMLSFTKPTFKIRIPGKLNINLCRFLSKLHSLLSVLPKLLAPVKDHLMSNFFSFHKFCYILGHIEKNVPKFFFTFIEKKLNFRYNNLIDSFLLRKRGIPLADSSLTKRALASALKELMAEIPFEKINVAHICEKCGMNRKSFYYHFKDKYDLVNWIFDTDFVSVVNNNIYDDHWILLENLSIYFYKNRTFYRKALKIKGQNSFSDHFRECLHPILQRRLECLTGNCSSSDFAIKVLADICICAFERWLSEKDCMPPEQFTSLIQSMTQSIAISLCDELKK